MRDRLKTLILPAAAFTLAACASAEPALTPEQAALEAAYEAERNDPFILMVSIERYTVLIDLAYEGAGEPPYDENETDMARATQATYEAARELYRLRERVCAGGLVEPDACGPLPPPDWLGAPPLEVADADEINRRILWLELAMGPFVDAGCDAGDARRSPDDPPFCSVE